MRFSDVHRLRGFDRFGAFGPQLAQETAARLFPFVVRELGFSFVDPGAHRPGATHSILVGVAAAYSPIDLKYLDRLTPAMTRSRDLVIEFADISDRASGEAMERLVPGSMAHAPSLVVSEWVDGHLARFGRNLAARSLLAALVRSEA